MVAVNYIGCGDHCAIDTDVKHVRYLKLKTVFCQLYLNGKKKYSCEEQICDQRNRSYYSGGLN